MDWGVSILSKDQDYKRYQQYIPVDFDLIVGIVVETVGIIVKIDWNYPLL